MNTQLPIPIAVHEEWMLAEHLVRAVTQSCSGELDAKCSHNKPSDVYFIGNFRPVPLDEKNYNKEILQKLAPSAFGAEYKINQSEDKFIVTITLSWSCYYRIFPSFEEQKKWMAERQTDIEPPKAEHAKTVKEEDTLDDPTLVKSFVIRERERRSSEELFVQYKKIEGKANGKIIFYKREGHWQSDTSSAQTAVNNEFIRLIELITADHSRMKKIDKDQKIRVSEEDIETEEIYRKFIGRFNDELTYPWGWEIQAQPIELNKGDNNVHILIRFVNISADDVKSQTFEPFLFNPKAEFTFEKSNVVPFQLELAPESFRYNRELWGKGFNCGICRNIDENKIESYSTTHTPIFRQKRYKTKEQPKADFEELANNPEAVLSKIEQAMQKDLASWEIEEKRYREALPSWDEKYGSEYASDKITFEKEIERFHAGFDLIQSDPDIMLAFKLTNQTFANAGRNHKPNKSKTSWRLFQIVFLTTQIPGIAALTPKHENFLNERNIVDIIFFPTGGGKTEAYLAVLIFNAFYDRIRGKKAGVTSWIRFPLRLLTVQQTQRLTDIIGNAELIRNAAAKENDKLKGTPFAVGYYVGGSSTPNELAREPYWNETNWSIAGDPIARQKWKRVLSCPACKSTNITVEFDPEKIKLLHKCNEINCGFPDGILPLYVVDEEIYRYLPTVIVGTIDKLANIGIKGHISMVFGKVDGFCTKHGYFNGNCTRFDCKDEKNLKRKKIPGLTGPSLFIQDELHLLKEGLGTFDSHYETFSQYLLKEFSGTQPLKIIASSATIEEYKRQIRHLYGRKDARIFPGKGPTLEESFYAETFRYPQRLFVGILPHNKTIFNAILELIEVYHEATHRLKLSSQDNGNLYGGTYNPASTEWNSLIDKYRTSLTYFLAGRELDSMKTDIEHYINPKFLRDGLTALTVKELTGGISTDDVTNTLELLERAHNLLEAEETVLATSMISHGVDIDRMNDMVFYGMPRQNAEYIQSSSRVGRTHVGIVFTCLHPIRERDQSHFAYFEKYHEFLGQLVEPVAINRWSTYSMDRTLPGLFMAALIQVIANQLSSKDLWKFERLDHVGKLLSRSEINEETFKKILREGYQINILEEPKDIQFNEKLDDRIIKYLDSIKRKSQLFKKVKEVLSPAPMNSLRDIDESIKIELDSAGTEWLRKKRTKDE